MYDVEIVGAGLSGCVIADVLSKRFKLKVVVKEKKPIIGGQSADRSINGLVCHTNGAHIFRTNNLSLIKYLEQYGELEEFRNRPIAFSRNKIIRLPFCLGTLYDIYGCSDVQKLIRMMNDDIVKYDEPQNIEEYALSKVGKKVYEYLIKDYTEKQWKKKCNELDVSIINELPIRMNWNNDYFDEKYQVVPLCGYSEIMLRMLSDVDLVVNESCRSDFSEAKVRVFTGSIDEYFDYEFGVLEYRSLEFDTKEYGIDFMYGNAVCNFADMSVDYTRAIEHKFFYKNPGMTKNTIVTYEYPVEFELGKNDRIYPILTDSNKSKYKMYANAARKEKNVFFAGRLGKYEYNTMDRSIEDAMIIAETIGGMF